MFVCLCGQCLEDSSNHCPFRVVYVCGDKQGRAGQGGQGSRCGGPRKLPFLLKKSLGKTGGPASNQTNFILFLNFIIKHIKKTRIFLKKKIKRK